jgi:NADH-quinone oxidoreductase subunit N
VIHGPHVDWFALAPSLALLAAAAVALLGAVLAPARWRNPFSAVVAATGFVVSFVFAVLLFAQSPHGEAVVAGAMRRDRFGALAAVIVAAAGLLSVGVSYGERLREHSGEYYALLAAAGGGMIFLGFADNLMTLFLGLEWFSIALYILCAIDGERERSLEAGLKYLVVGGFGSAILLFGSALVYGATGQIGFEQIAEATAAQHLSGDALLVGGLAMLLVGFGFKTSAAPFHMWTPDVYEGAPTPVTAFMSAATKTAALAVMLRVLVTAFPAEKHLWTITVAVLVGTSLVVGNFAALAQSNVKRMLAYSSVSQAGFMLIGVAAGNKLGAESVLYYLIPYGAMSIGAFAVVAARERELGTAVTFDNLAGFGWERPLLGASMATFMLGFAGFPLTGGFMGKFLVFSAADEQGWWWLTVVGVAATALSLYYYLGVVRAMYMRPSEELQFAPAGGSPPRELLLQIVAGTCVAITVASFVFVQPLLDLAQKAVAALPY